MDREKLNENEENAINSTTIKKHEKRSFSKPKTISLTSYINNNQKLLKELSKLNTIKRHSKKELNHFGSNNNKTVSLIRSNTNNRNFANNIFLNGFTLHDALYLGKDLRNNKGIRANDISCYLSNTSIYQPIETNYKLIEKNIQNKIMDMSMEIFENKKGIINSKLSDDSLKKIDKKPKRQLSKKMAFFSLKDKNKKSKSNNLLLKTSFQQSLSIKSHDTSAFLIFKEQQIDKNRKITKKKVLYDSLAEDESDENMEEDGNGLNPQSLFIDIFDCLLLLSSFFCLFYIPYRLAKDKLIIEDSEYIILSLIYFSEIIYLFDLIFGFFRWYYNNELKIVKNNNMILKNYLFGNFLMDLIEAIPFYTILKFAYLNKEDIFQHNKLFNEKFLAIKIFSCFKAFKIFKINDRKNNRAIQYLNKKFSDNYLSERIYQITNFVLVTISVINIFICFHIYIGKLTYPNWILVSKLRDESFIQIYLASLYFIMATMTSVGYGDIVCINKEETCFQILLLSIGIVAYSWIISTVGDYVKNETRATIKYNKDITQLEEIRIAYPNMPFKLYNKIHQHLHRLLKQQEKYDSNLLINSLPYTLKNSLIFEIHKDVISRFIFFNGCENSAFILKVITHFIPLISKKNAILIKEGEIIENIFFVKDGRLALEAAIDLDNIEESIEKYLEYQFIDISSIIESEEEDLIPHTKIEKKVDEKKAKIKNYNDLYNIVNRQTQLIGDVSYMHESHIEEEIGKCDLNGENEEEIEQGNHQFLHIIDVLKNEHFGEVYMLLNKPSPLSLRVKSKKVDLFLLRKKDTLNIKKDYPNIWNRISERSMHNMKSIKNLTKRVINGYCKMNGIIIEKDIMERSDHLFGCKESESYDINKDLSCENNNNNINKKRINKKTSSVLKRKYSLSNKRASNGCNSMSPGKKERIYDPYSTSFKIKSNKYGGNSPKTKPNFRKSVALKRPSKLNEIFTDSDDEIINTKKSIKRGKSLKVKKDDRISKQISKNSSLSLQKSDNSLNRQINKNENNFELTLKNNINDVILNPPINDERSKKIDNILKLPENIDNCQLSNIQMNTTNINDNFFDVSEKNKIINQNNNMTIINTNIISQIQDIKNNKDSILPLIKNMNGNSKKIYFKESTVKLEFLASYNNINKMAKGKYINNKTFQKVTKRFIKYYANSLLTKNANLNDKIDNKNNDSFFNKSSIKYFLTESSIKKSTKEISKRKIYSDKKIISGKKEPKIKKFKNSTEIQNKYLTNKNIKIENNLKNDSKENENILKHQNSSNISVISDSRHKLEERDEIFFNNVNDNKDINFWGKTINSETKITNNISNSNYLFGKNLLSKKDKIEKLSEIKKKFSEDKLFNSSQNIINNKSNKNINEVNINFTNNFCQIF